MTGNDYEEVHQDSRGRGSYSCGRGRGHNYNQSDRKDRYGWCEEITDL